MGQKYVSEFKESIIKRMLFSNNEYIYSHLVPGLTLFIAEEFNTDPDQWDQPFQKILGLPHNGISRDCPGS